MQCWRVACGLFHCPTQRLAKPFTMKDDRCVRDAAGVRAELSGAPTVDSANGTCRDMKDFGSCFDDAAISLTYEEGALIVGTLPFPGLQDELVVVNAFQAHEIDSGPTSCSFG